VHLVERIPPGNRLPNAEAAVATDMWFLNSWQRSPVGRMAANQKSRRLDGDRTGATTDLDGGRRRAGRKSHWGDGSCTWHRIRKRSQPDARIDSLSDGLDREELDVRVSGARAG